MDKKKNKAPWMMTKKEEDENKLNVRISRKIPIFVLKQAKIKLHHILPFAYKFDGANEPMKRTENVRENEHEPQCRDKKNQHRHRHGGNKIERLRRFVDAKEKKNKKKYVEREQITKYRHYSIIICDFIHFMNISVSSVDVEIQHG